jgi:hypothetical protein
MNRRSFFARMLGAACLAAAERVLPSSLAKLAAPVPEAVADWTSGGGSIKIRGLAIYDGLTGEPIAECACDEQSEGEPATLRFHTDGSFSLVLREYSES